MPFKKTVSGLIDWLVYENEEELFVVKVSDIYIKISYKNIVQDFHVLHILMKDTYEILKSSCTQQEL